MQVKFFKSIESFLKDFLASNFRSLTDSLILFLVFWGHVFGVWQCNYFCCFLVFVVFAAY